MVQMPERVARIETILQNQNKVLDEIETDVKSLLTDKITRDVERRTVRKMAAYVSAMTAGAIQFLGMAAQAYWGRH